MADFGIARSDKAVTQPGPVLRAGDAFDQGSDQHASLKFLPRKRGASLVSCELDRFHMLLLQVHGLELLGLHVIELCVDAVSAQQVPMSPLFHNATLVQDVYIVGHLDR